MASPDKITQAVKARQAKTQVHGVNPLYAVDASKKTNVALTTKQISKMFGVTTMTIYNWRQHKGMPFEHLSGGEKPPVRYDEGLIFHWAKAHGIPIASTEY